MKKAEELVNKIIEIIKSNDPQIKLFGCNKGEL
jgi:hypothetical protein